MALRCSSSAHARVRCPRPARRFLVPFLLLLGALALPRPLLAHAHLLRSTPAAGSTLTTPPDAIHLVFSERPELRFTTVRLLAADGREVPLAVPAMAIEGSEAGILVAIHERLASGRYTVEWQTGSADGHPVKGRFRFAVKLDSAAIAPSPSHSALPAPVGPTPRLGDEQGQPHDSTMNMGADTDEGVVELPFGYRVARWFEFLGLLTTVGVVVFGRLVLPSLSTDPELAGDAWRRARTLGLVAWTIVLVASLARLYGEGVAMHGPGNAFDMVKLSGMVGGTRWGIGWGVGVIGALLIMATLLLRPTQSRSTLAVLAVIGACVSPALTGHAAATRGALAIPAVLFDLCHVIGASAWLGTLASIAFAGIPAAVSRPREIRGPAVARMFAAFHPIGMWSVGLILLSGIGSSWIRLGSIAELTMSNYGSVLLFKVYAFLFVGLMGAYNWKKVLPRLGDDEGTHLIRRNIRIELVVGLVVLALTAVLVVTNPPR